MIIYLWQQEKITVSGIHPLTLSTIAMQLMLLVKHPRQHTRTGSRNKAFARIKGHMSSPPLCCAKEFKAIQYIFCIVDVFYICCIFCISYSVNVSNILACFQHESMMAWKSTTGITRIVLLRQMYLSGLIAGSNNQMRHCQAGTFLGFASTFGIAQRYVDCWSTLYLVVGFTIWVNMQ
jgi:hypothetical protein